MDELVRRLDVQIAATCTSSANNSSTEGRAEAGPDHKDIGELLRMSSGGRISMPQPVVAVATQRPLRPKSSLSSQRPSVIGAGSLQAPSSNLPGIKSRQASLKPGHRGTGRSSLARFPPTTLETINRSTRENHNNPTFLSDKFSSSSLVPNEDDEIIYWYKYDRRSKSSGPIFGPNFIALPLKIPIGKMRPILLREVIFTLIRNITLS